MQPAPCPVHDRLLEKLEALLLAHAEHLNTVAETASSVETAGDARRACAVAEQMLDVHDSAHGCQAQVLEACVVQADLLKGVTLASQRAIEARRELLKAAARNQSPTPFVFSLGEAVMDENSARIALAAHRKIHGC